MTVTEVFVCGMFAITMTFTPYQIRIGRGSTSISNQNSRTSHRIDAVGCLATLLVTGRSVEGLGPFDEGACKFQVVTKSTAKSGRLNGLKAYTAGLEIQHPGNEDQFRALCEQNCMETLFVNDN